MSIAFINLIFVNSLFAGVISNTNKQVVNTFTGNIMMLPPDGEDFFKETSQIKTDLESIDKIEAVSPQIIVPASMKYKNVKGNWTILAVDPELEKGVTNIYDNMTEGEYLSPDDTDQIIIGRQIAGGEEVEMNAFSFQDAKVGDKVTLSFDSQSKEFTIKGIFYTKFLETDKRAFITNKAFNEMFPGSENTATSFIMKISKTGEEAKVIEEIKAKNIKGKFYGWEEAAGIMKAITKSFVSINVIMSIVGILIAAVTIFIVIYIDVTSKRQQVGILRAIGVRPYLINATYILQTVVYSLSGIAIGTAIFFGLIVTYFKAYPFSLPIGDVTLVLEYADYIMRLEIFVWVSMLAGIIPSLLVTRVKILDAIWGNK
jgi:putative ABC transport system permease protein